MAIMKTEAVILRRREVRETSLLLVAFSRDLGKIHGLVKGVRGARAAVPWFLEPLTLQAMVLYERRRSPVSLVSSCDLMDAFEPIRRDLTKTAYASYCLDLVDMMTQVSDPHPEIFHLLCAVLRALEEGADPRSMARFLEAHLLRVSGLLPQEQETFVSSAEGRLAFRQIVQTPWDRISVFRLSRAVEEELRGILHRLLRGVLEGELKSRSFLYALALEGPVDHGPPVLPCWGQTPRGLTPLWRAKVVGS